MTKPKIKNYFSFSFIWLLLATFANAQCPVPTLTPVNWAGGTGNLSSGAGSITLSGTGTYSVTQMYENGEAAYVTLAGNGQIQAQLQSVTGFLGANTVAGIFIRGGANAGADGGLLWVGGPSLTTSEFADRTHDGPLTELESSNLSLPYWLRLQNSGYVLYPSVSTDGANWTPLPTPSYDLSGDVTYFVGTTIIYGLMVWSGSVSSPTTAVFGNVCISSLPTFTPPPTSTLTASPTSTVSFTPSKTPTSTGTFTLTVTPTTTFTPTRSPSFTPTPTITSTPTFTNTPTITATPTNTLSPMPTFTPTNTLPATSTPTPPPGMLVWPNPFTPQLSPNNHAHFLLPPGHGAGQLVIVDLRRRKIRSLDFSPGEDVQWDGQDDGGNVVSSGVYLYLLESDGTVRRGTVTVMR
jgi:hypothetical protein